MAASVTVKGGILRWARETYGLTAAEASAKAHTDVESLQAWEEGAKAITLPKLKYFANLYKRPLTVFFLPAAPAVQAFPPDFRTLDSVRSEELPPSVRLAVRRANRNRKIMQELFEMMDEKWHDHFGQHSLKDDPERLAGIMRKKVGVSLEEQFKWEDKSAALRAWINALEDKGVLVSQTTLPVEEMRGFCLRGSGLPPAVVLNTADEEAGRIFSLWHEFAHTLIPHAEIETVEKAQGADGAHRRIEIFANHFAGAFLVPKENLLGHGYLEKFKVTRGDFYLTRIASTFKVSTEVILRRMLMFGIIDEAFYGQKRAEIEEAMRKRRAKKEEADGFQLPSQKALASTGTMLSARLFDAQSKGKISPSDVAGFFEVKTKHFGNIKALLDRRFSP